MWKAEIALLTQELEGLGWTMGGGGGDAKKFLSTILGLDLCLGL